MAHDTPGAMDVAVSLGPCDDLRAHVYVRAVYDRTAHASPADDPAPPFRIEGTIQGPECRHATTLPTSARLVDLGGGGSAGALVGRITLTEPSFWTPQLPSLYRLDVRLIAGSLEVARSSRRVGLRRLGVRGRSFWLDGHRWVPRAVGLSDGGAHLAALRGNGASAFVVAPTDAILTATDAEGVAVVARLPDAPTNVTEATMLLMHWSQHPSVTIAVVPRGWPEAAVTTLASSTRRARGTMLLARAVAGGEPPASACGCDALVVDLAPAAVPHDSWRGVPDVPLVACRMTADGDVVSRRGACDRLQADLAAWGIAAGVDRLAWDWGGYAIA